MKISFYIALLLSATLLWACNDKVDPLPYANINIKINPDSPMYPELNTVGGFVTLTANYPSRGIIVYRLSTNTFMAYERSCPYDANACCTQDTCSRLVVDADALRITDPCCQSKFLIIDGSVSKGPATYPLKQYKADYSGGTLHIYN